ncbi:MAG: tRNA uridine-5-carboxymethylaminomethyl(34) synthesis enzyme MnmG [Candidatus Cloacimonadota bacterium]|nr:MAG: tRNA uridine-5-carboxymethylaminomethyl(34) synthesis enzyme MnmG [Candidatus Cloacimonadota bacterium]
MSQSQSYDVIVVGAGHSGCEAGLVSARMGAKTAVFVMQMETIARMSCNPSIGGLAKGHLVREIDALGGEMGKAIDKAGIHFRMLNQSKGPAVWAPRAQADRTNYHLQMRNALEQQDNLDIIEGIIEEIIVKHNKIQGVITNYNERYLAKAVILANGTFLRGLIHVGKKHYTSGRAGELSADKLSYSLLANGLELCRFKTGTPPRLDKRRIDFSVLEVQEPDEPPVKFSHYTNIIPKNYFPCYLTYTNQNTHKIIKEHITESSLFSGNIKGIGPRYCPSIEDKIKKFPEKKRHQVFLEPEGLISNEIYPNGISTSFPPYVQRKIVKSIKGLENAHFVRFGYAIEYDYIPPDQIYPSLETKKIEGLFLAGQINGTSGYEEAGAQGIVAGINAVRKIQKKSPIIFDRANSYIGVLIDDLVTKGTDEPYRMFTSRAEYRLNLRQDNADERLMPLGYELGIVKKEIYDKFQNMLAIKQRELEKITTQTVSNKQDLQQKIKYIDLLKRPNINFDDLQKYGYKIENDVSELIKNKINLEIKYAGYIKRQMENIEKFKYLENKEIPSDFNYVQAKALSYESREKLNKVRPYSVGQASRIPGVTNADISVLLILLKKGY